MIIFAFDNNDDEKVTLVNLVKARDVEDAEDRGN